MLTRVLMPKRQQTPPSSQAVNEWVVSGGWGYFPSEFCETVLGFLS